MLSTLTDHYGPRLTGSREYLAAAKWMKEQLTSFGLENVVLEETCNNCRGWSIKGFNVELVSPNYMNIIAYPLAMTKSSNGVVEGEVIQIKKWWQINEVKKQFTGKLKGKVILMGSSKNTADLTKTLQRRYKKDELIKLEEQIVPENNIEYLPDMVDDWLISDRDDQAFFQFLEDEGAIGVLTTNDSPPGLLRVEKTFYFLDNDYQPLPVFSIIPEHFGRISRILAMGTIPKIKFFSDVEFYKEPKNHVNILAEIKGTNPKYKSEVVLVGGHFDSWHASTGATDNGVNVIVLAEALRILKAIGYKPKKTIRLGLWSGEEQAYYGSLNYAKRNFGELRSEPNTTSKTISAYLNLDNGAGSIRGIYLQGNEFAKPFFKKAFKTLEDITEGITTIENQPSSDHQVFDHYNIPSFQLIQDPLAFYTMTLHTNMDVFEYVPKEDVLKNAVIMAWLLYSIAESEEMVPRKF